MRLCFDDNKLDVLERDPFFRTNVLLVLPAFTALCVPTTQQAHPQYHATKHFDMVQSNASFDASMHFIATVLLKPRSGDGVVIRTLK
jgi:hypothetical protein